MIYFLLLLSLAHAQPVDIAVGPAGISQPDTRTTLLAPDLRDSAALSGEDVLRAVPGLTIARQGGLGQPSFVYIRGADSEGTLVIVDGVPVNDPGSTNRSFDFSTFTLDGVEKIEVLKGPQSVLYGSGATGGVILITTRKGHGPRSGTASAEVGSWNSSAAKLNVRGSDHDLAYAVSASQAQSNGISAAAPSHGGFERDPSSLTSIHARAGWTPDGDNEVEGLGQWTGRHTSLDYAPSPTGVEADAPNYRAQAGLLNTALSAHHRWSADVQTTALLARTAQDRNYSNDADPQNPGWVRGHFTGETYHAESRTHWRLRPGLELDGGLFADYESAASEYVTDSFNSSVGRRSTSMTGAMARAQFERAIFFANAGARADTHSLFGDQFNFEASPGAHITADDDVFLRYATGFKVPTLYELYAPVFGNDRLQPEHARAEEVSWSHYFPGRRGKIQISGFYNQYRDLISFYQSGYHNVGSAMSEGAEVEAGWDLGWLRLQAGYTYLESRDDSTGQALLRRPRNSLAAKAEIQFTPRVTGALEYTGVDHRMDIDPVSNQAVVDASYQVLNASAGWQIAPAWKAYAHVINLLNSQYEEVAGYGAYPLSVYAGGIYSFE